MKTKINRNRMSRVIYEAVAVMRSLKEHFCMSCGNNIGMNPYIKYTSRYYSETSQVIRKFTYILCIGCCKTMTGTIIARCLRELEKKRLI